jgi:hypothetical protein
MSTDRAILKSCYHLARTALVVFLLFSICSSALVSVVHAQRDLDPRRHLGREELGHATSAPLQKGISYTGWWAGEYQRPSADLSLQRLSTTGADWVALVVTGHQDGPAATTINRLHDPSPTDADLIHVIQNAHNLGLKVMLKPHLDLPNERETGIWRGYIGTEFSKESEWTAWFAAYTEFIVHYATLAQRHGADQFCVGTELMGTSHREEDWRRVVAAVRDVYDGPLVYAALHGGEEVSITWWDAVDFIGVDAYYRLNECDLGLECPTVEELIAAWEGPKQRLADLSARHNRPILLTEIGYRSFRGCTHEPWDSWVEGPLDLQEQANAYEATFRSLYHEPWLGGIFWWQWRADIFLSGSHNYGYTPVDKPAEDVLRAWYGGEPTPQEPMGWPDYDRTLDIYRDQLEAPWQDWSWGAESRFDAQEHVYVGTQSIAVTLDPWGALSLWHPPFSTSAYGWLEFAVLGSQENIQLQVYMEAEDGTPLCHVPVNDPRHIEGGSISTQTWRTVRLPLAYLNAPDVPVNRISIQSQEGARAVTLWIDAIRFVGAQEGQPFHTVSVPLSAGWNLAALPGKPLSGQAMDLFASLDGQLDRAYIYDAARGAWRAYQPQGTGDSAVQDLREGQGVWVHMAGATPWEMSVQPLTTLTMELHQGWNLVGYSLLVGQDLAAAAAPLGERLLLVYGHDGTNPWSTFLPAMSSASTLTRLEPGRGYWVKVSEACNWTLQSP